MALIRWEPARELQSLQHEMNRLFGTFFESAAPVSGSSPARRWIPAMDLEETETHFVLRADLPGLSEEDVKIELEDNVLTLSGERRSEHEDRRQGFYRIERASGAFARSLTLPEGVDPAGIAASFHNGVLEVRIPKPEVRKPHRVSISVGGQAAAIEGSETPSPPAAGGSSDAAAPRAQRVGAST
jgi:HSP20 family protein